MIKEYTPHKDYESYGLITDSFINGQYTQFLNQVKDVGVRNFSLHLSYAVSAHLLSEHLAFKMLTRATKYLA